MNLNQASKLAEYLVPNQSYEGKLELITETSEENDSSTAKKDISRK